MPNYSASKAALLQLSVSLAKRLAGTGVTVNTVGPGIVATEAIKRWYRAVGAERGWDDDWAGTERAVVREVLRNPVGRLGREEEVADRVAVLVSLRAGYLNASNFRLDGGAAPAPSTDGDPRRGGPAATRGFRYAGEDGSRAIGRARDRRRRGGT
jgi:NAD(P)-dependent dehydrogenase (short-subunit alcohol dehydrogenase family)